jgi:hypothetical protein
MLPQGIKKDFINETTAANSLFPMTQDFNDDDDLQNDL